MSAATDAIHAIRNDLTPIFFFAEMAADGDSEAQKLAIEEMVSRTDAIQAELDVLTRVIRRDEREAAA
jgi:hypothetical protein